MPVSYIDNIDLDEYSHSNIENHHITSNHNFENINNISGIQTQYNDSSDNIVNNKQDNRFIIHQQQTNNSIASSSTIGTNSLPIIQPHTGIASSSSSNNNVCNRVNTTGFTSSLVYISPSLPSLISTEQTTSYIPSS